MCISIVVLPRRQGRQWDWGAGTVCRDTSISVKHHLHFLFSHMGRLQISGGLGGHQEEGIPGSGRLNACSSKALFSAQSCLIQCFSHMSSSSCFVQEMSDSHSTKHEKMPLFLRPVNVLESRTPLKEMGLNREVGFSFSFYRTKLGFLLLPRPAFWKLKWFQTAFVRKSGGRQLLFPLTC